MILDCAGNAVISKKKS